MKIIISIPAYNEEKTLPKVLDEIKAEMSKNSNKTSYNYEILIVNDGSTDKTANVAKEAGAHLVSHKRNKGLAETFKTEMKWCLKLKADLVVHTDADGQYPAKYIPKMIAEVQNGYDLVLGSRFGQDNHSGYSGSLIKKLGNKAFAKVFSGLLNSKISDTTTGFRAFNKEVAQLPLINRFTYTQEQLIRAGREKMRVKEIPITTNKTRPSRLFSNPLNYALKAWLNIFRIYRDFDPLKFFGRIGLLFLALGALFAIWILITFLQTNSVGGIPRVILCALFFTTGIQIILFGLLADMLKR